MGVFDGGDGSMAAFDDVWDAHERDSDCGQGTPDNGARAEAVVVRVPLPQFATTLT